MPCSRYTWNKEVKPNWFNQNQELSAQVGHDKETNWMGNDEQRKHSREYNISNKKCYMTEGYIRYNLQTWKRQHSSQSQKYGAFSRST